MAQHYSGFIQRGFGAAKLCAILITLVLACGMAGPVRAQPVESFSAFIKGFEPKARAAGVSAQTYQNAMAGLTADPDIVRLVSGQPEFTTPIWTYIEQRVSRDRIARGKAAMARHAGLFKAIGEQSGVDPAVLGAIWGLETDYGAVLSNKTLIKPIVRSLATLVHLRRSRLVADEADLIAALLLTQANGGREPVGSWAGAIGNLQVNPSNVLAHGSDGDGDGRIDLDTSLADALATSAKFLRDLGYRPGLDWGFEVQLPDNFDYQLAGRTQYRTVGFFADLGVTRVLGRTFASRSLSVFLYVPAGKDGPKFLMTPNYLALKGYNFSDSYALSVAHMTDRLKGSGPLSTPWPRGAKLPDLAQRKAIQQNLIKLGLYQGVVDGMIGPVSQAAYARFQASRGQAPDGFITVDSFHDLSAATR